MHRYLVISLLIFDYTTLLLSYYILLLLLLVGIIVPVVLISTIGGYTLWYSFVVPYINENIYEILKICSSLSIIIIPRVSFLYSLLFTLSLSR